MTDEEVSNRPKLLSSVDEVGVTVHYVPDGATRQGSFTNSMSRAVQHKVHSHTGDRTSLSS